MSPLPWWSDECREAVTERVRSERALRRHYTIENKISYNRAKARCKYLCNQARKKSWEIFWGTINQVKVALGNRGMTVEAARQCAKDRKEWRALVHM